MSGEIRIVLDPGGYSWSAEPGLDFAIRGDQIAGRMGKDRNGNPVPFMPASDYFWRPPESQWLLPRLRQWDPEWYANADNPAQYLGASNWVWAPGFTVGGTLQVTEAHPYLKAGGPSLPGDSILDFLVPAVPGAEPMPVNWSAFWAAAGLAPLAGFQCIARTTKSLAGYQSPFCGIVQRPAPDDPFVMGWGDLALFISAAWAVLLRSPNNDAQTWEQLAAFQRDQQTGGAKMVPHGPQDFHATPRAGDIRIVDGSFVAVPVGFDDLCLGIGRASLQLVRLRDSTRAGPAATLGTQVKPGPWWMAALPGAAYSVRPEVVRYFTAEHAVLDDTVTPTAQWWDWQDEYAPTVAPQLWDHHVLYSTAAATVTALSGYGYEIAGAGYGDKIEVRLLDRLNHAFVADGTHTSGAIRLKLTPGNNPDFGALCPTACVAPQVRLIQLRFPPKLQARATNTQILTGEGASGKFTHLQLEGALRDPLGKRVEVLLTDPGLQFMEGIGFLGRSDYPVHVEEQTAPGLWTVRARAWAETSEYHEESLTGPSGNSMRAYRMTFRGLLQKVQTAGRVFTSALVDPVNAGNMFHDTLAVRILTMGGFAPGDPLVAVTADPVGALIRTLPGSGPQDPGSAGVATDSSWAPGTGEGNVDYVHRLGRDWRGWLLYEQIDGTMVYGPDPIDAALAGVPPFPFATLYPNGPWATAARVPRNVYEAPTETVFIPVESNWVRVIGNDLDGNPLQVTDCDARSIGDMSAWNYIGERKAPSTVRLMAVSLLAAKQLARMLVQRLRVKREMKKIPVGCAPWEIQPLPLEVGDEFSIYDRLGLSTRLIAHVEATYLGGGQWRTLFTAESLPPPDV